MRIDAVGAIARPTPPGTFHDFYETHRRRLFQAMYLLTSDVHEADDLAQEALVRVFERWDRVAAMASPEGYLYRTALNLFRSRARRAARWARRTFGATPIEDPATTVAARGDVHRALAALTRDQRDALVLVDWVGLSPAEVASIQGIQPVSVRSRLHRARSALRKELEVDG